MRRLEVVVVILVGILVNLSWSVTTAQALAFSDNAVWIQDTSWVTMNPNVLTRNLSKVVDDLSHGNVRFAFVFAGYWNANTSTIVYNENDSVFATVINALHVVNIEVLAWVVNDGAINVSAGNRQRLYDQTAACMNKGFDGYNDDIEDWNGTLQDWIDYENNCTTLLHGLNKLMTTDVELDWQQNINPYLHVDYIVSMCYSNVSALESPDAAIFWQEDFGEYRGHDTPPGSPLIMGIMNYYGNEHPLSWQLEQVDKYLNTYAHPELAGFSLWLYEYMGTNADDWSQWNSWMTTEVPEYQPVLLPLLFMIAVLLVAARFGALARARVKSYTLCHARTRRSRKLRCSASAHAFREFLPMVGEKVRVAHLGLSGS